MARAKPGITRFTACNPKPRIPNRIMKKLVCDFLWRYFVVAIQLGPDPSDAAIPPFVSPPVVESIVNALISLEFSFATYTNLPVESIVMKTGRVPAAKGDFGVVSSVGTPVLESRANADTLFPPKFAT